MFRQVFHELGISTRVRGLHDFTLEVEKWITANRLRDGLQARIGNARVRLDQGADAEPGTLTERELRGDLIAAENAELARLFEAGAIGAATRQRLQRGLDLELARFTEGQR